MAINSCDHDDFIVVYEITGHKKLSCPVCDMEKDFENLQAEVETLQDEKD